MSWFQWRGEELFLEVRLQPRASRDEIIGPHGEQLKIRITAPPVDGEANAHLIKFLAKAFGVPPSSVTLVNGQTGRDKRIRIAGPRELPPVTGVTRQK